MNAKCKKIFSALIICLLLALALPAPAFADEPQTTIRIVHTNDLHGYYKAASRGQIGFAALKVIIERQNAGLVLDIGDTFHGQAFATVEQGASMAELMDEVGYDAMTPGNHDWSYGAQRLKELDDAYNFTILAANVKKEDSSDFFDAPYLVKNVTADDGKVLKVGVVGVIDDAFYSSTVPDNVAGLTFYNEAEETSKIAELLRRRENCDIVIAIAHQSDCEGFVSKISGIDAVIAGHEHILIDKTYSDSDGKQVPVVEAGSYFSAVGVLSLTFDVNLGKVIAASEKVYRAEDTADMSDERIMLKIDSIEKREAAILQERIGYSGEEFPYSWEEIRTGEQAIGRIVTAAYLDWTGADVAMENAGGIRSGIPEGDVAYADLISISPYGNILVLKELTGRQILDIAEYSLELSRRCDEIYSLQKEAAASGKSPYDYSWPDDSGSVLQFGGLQLEYDMSRPQGSRVQNAKIGVASIDLNKKYIVATNNYVSVNTDYPAIAKEPLLMEYGTCEEALRRYIKKGAFEADAANINLKAVAKADEQRPPQTGDDALSGRIVILLFSGSMLAALYSRRRGREMQ